MKKQTLEESIADRVDAARNTYYVTRQRDSERFHASDYTATPAEQRRINVEKKQAWLKQLSKRRF